MQLKNHAKTPTVLLTGATGFVGGAILSTLCKDNREIKIKALLRREEDAQELQSVYSNLTAIAGDLSSLELLKATAASVDFVIHAGGDNASAVCAMIDGLAMSSTTADVSPRLISVSGPRSLIDTCLPITGIANPDSRPWSDVEDVSTILNLPKWRMHAETDQAIIAHAVAKSVGAMLVSPGQLFGRGIGHMKKESHAALYYSLVKNRGRAFVIGNGSATWSWISIGDLGEAIVFLMEQAISNGNKVGVNVEGYYFLRTGDVSMKERAEAVSKRLGLAEVESISVESAKQMHPFGGIMWGCGARTRADRLARLGWKPRDTDWRVLMEEEGGQRA